MRKAIAVLGIIIIIGALIDMVGGGSIVVGVVGIVIGAALALQAVPNRDK